MNEQRENDQAVDEPLKQLIAQQVNNALQAIVSRFPTIPPTPPPNNNATVENPRLGLVKSGSGGTPSESRDGESGSSLNIILLRVVNEMQANDKLIPKARTLSGFENSSVITKGEIILTTFAEGVVIDTKCQVIELDMAYDMILSRLWIHEMDVVPSTLHQVIKFPSQWGIQKICGNQQASRSINSVADSSAKSDEK
ncbi:PREDICTED: uncharacterized protein LOC109217766 [Nicotiana attenuata]|uniref:uncharacterized protein LOC109217766 n=1 Tax=Nicotiana attenuata TaxID=49451 RepID=UPI000905A635|nr:PREDICTED: uncharacterized protein LOC109217766 [Nicotiana attenuata]